MKTWIALFRGINVGGKQALPMQELRGLLAAIGCADVQTYIQSGNAVFRSAAASASSLAPKKPDLEALERVKGATEAFALEGRTFYLHTPDGFGTSKLAERAERLLGVEATARNWRTVCALLEMTA
ncbi:MAG TPA: DUF1697 domain-containing protein [Steroidobacteraceae bacterium]|nr:DUF1697 domain-containing protein [Steroidobacteraceae bacterium]